MLLTGVCVGCQMYMYTLVVDNDDDEVDLDERAYLEVLVGMRQSDDASTVGDSKWVEAKQ